MGRVAIVTGASRGIGLEVAKRLAREGIQVVACSRTSGPWHGAGAEPVGKGSVLYLQMDASRTADLEGVVSLAMDRFGQIDILVNNAGDVPYYGMLMDAGLDDFEATFRVNLTAPFLLTKYVVLASMQHRGGSVVNVGALSAIRTVAQGYGVIGVAKAAVLQLTKHLANELGPLGVRVNAVVPGVIDTKASRLEWEDAAKLRAWKAAIPLRRMGKPEEVAEVIAFLVSDGASYVNGCLLGVEGGVLA